MNNVRESARKLAAAPVQLRAAYAVCRHVARSSARNFYYGFLVLPRRKRDAISAVYAFMRHADDISDDPNLDFREKRNRLQAWLDAMHEVIAGGPTDDPVLLALADTQRRFDIPVEWLEKLVQGTAMDIVQEQAEITEASHGQSMPPVMYRTFEELYAYCYHVASVVGLVSIRIFGYRDRAAEGLAERIGVAFQLTNILRDVREDISLGRIYLPQEDFERLGIPISSLQNGSAATALKPLLAVEADRAREYYRSAPELLPLIEQDAQPALWTLVEIYRRLLEKIVAQDYNVFSQRISLTTAEKVRVLSRGVWRRLTT